MLIILNLLCICAVYTVVITSFFSIIGFVFGLSTRIFKINNILFKNFEKSTRYELIVQCTLIPILYYFFFKNQMWNINILFLWERPFVLLILYLYAIFIIYASKTSLPFTNNIDVLLKYSIIPMIYLIVIGNINLELINVWSIKYGIILAGVIYILFRLWILIFSGILNGYKIFQRYRDSNIISNIKKIYQYIDYIGDPIEKNEYVQLVNNDINEYKKIEHLLKQGKIYTAESLLISIEIEIEQILNELQNKIELFSKEAISSKKDIAKNKLNKLLKTDVSVSVVNEIEKLINNINEINDDTLNEENIKNIYDRYEELDNEIGNIYRIYRFYNNLNLEFDLLKEDFLRTNHLLLTLSSFNYDDNKNILVDLKEKLIRQIEIIKSESNISYEKLIENYITYKKILFELRQENTSINRNMMKNYIIDNINEDITLVIPRICSTVKDYKGLIIHKKQQDNNINLKSAFLDFIDNNIKLFSSNEYNVEIITFTGKKNGRGTIKCEINGIVKDYKIKCIPSDFQIVQNTLAFAVPLSGLVFLILWLFSNMDFSEIGAISGATGGGFSGIFGSVNFIIKQFELRKYK